MVDDSASMNEPNTLNGNIIVNKLKNKIRTREQTLTIYTNSSLTHLSPMSCFNTPRKRQKTHGFMTFSGGVKM